MSDGDLLLTGQNTITCHLEFRPTNFTYLFKIHKFPVRTLTKSHMADVYSELTRVCHEWQLMPVTDRSHFEGLCSILLAQHGQARAYLLRCKTVFQLSSSPKCSMGLGFEKQDIHGVPVIFTSKRKVLQCLKNEAVCIGDKEQWDFRTANTHSFFTNF